MHVRCPWCSCRKSASQRRTQDAHAGLGGRPAERLSPWVLRPCHCLGCHWNSAPACCSARRVGRATSPKATAIPICCYMTPPCPTTGSYRLSSWPVPHRIIVLRRATGTRATMTAMQATSAAMHCYADNTAAMLDTPAASAATLATTPILQRPWLQQLPALLLMDTLLTQYNSNNYSYTRYHRGNLWLHH